MRRRLRGLTEATEYGQVFKTGKPVCVRFVRSTEGAPDFGERYQQHIEPAGRYMIHNPEPGDLPRRWEKGEVCFKKPLVLEFNEDPGGGYDAKSWKVWLHDKYKRKGRALSKHLRCRLGYDGIVTVKAGVLGRGATWTAEIVDLTGVKCGRR